MKNNVGESILPIPKKDRYANSLSLFWIWAGGNVLLASFMVGSNYAESLGLIPMIVASIFANLAAYTLCAWSAQRAGKYGLDELVSVRPTFGYRGSLFGVVILIFINFGWIGILAAMSGSATQTIAQSIHPNFSFTGDYSVYAITCGILIPLILLLLTPKSGFLLSKITVPILIIFSLYVLLKLAFSPALWSQMAAVEPTHDLSWMYALEACVAYAVAWQPYLGSWNKFAKTQRGAFWGTYLGLGLIGILYAITGGMATLITGEFDPSVWAAELDLGVSSMIIIILGTITSVAILLYGGIMAVLSVFPKWNYHVVAICLALPSISLIYINSMSALFDIILLFVGLLAGPYWAVVIADYKFLRKEKINVKECFNPKGIYHYHNGVNWVAVFAQVVGMIVWLYLGGWTSGFDFLTFESGLSLFNLISATLPAMTVSGIVYIIAARYYFRNSNDGGYEFSYKK